MTTYILAGGCFWCLDAVFRQLKGVVSSVCGYAGDTEETAEYMAVASGQTKHAESVAITFDENAIPSDVILDIYFMIHDPTSLNQQGADIGTQYRSAMFYADNTQRAVFSQAIKARAPEWDDPIVTTIERLEAFYEAEEEHRDFFNKRPNSGYCTVVINPKISKSRAVYSKWFKD